MSASTVIPDRFTFGIVISGAKEAARRALIHGSAYVEF
jgi:hypothetical protein